MSDKTETKEPQNQAQVDDYRRLGPAKLGPWTSHIWRHDPRHLGFLLARYKFVAKMLEGRESALEVGCGDAIGTPVVLQTVDRVHGIDFEPVVVEDAAARFTAEGQNRASFAVHDILDGPLPESFDAAYSLDVIEHVETAREPLYLGNIARSLNSQGVLIIGTPNVTAATYASEGSRLGHINLKSRDDLVAAMGKYFHNVFSFSMNDEVVHTGYAPMAHYLFAMGVGVRGDAG